MTNYKALILAPNSPCKSWGTASLINTQMVSSVYHVENVHLNMCQISNLSQHPQGCPFWSHSPTQPLFFLLQCWAKNPSSASCTPSKDSLIHSFGHFKVTANKNATKWSLNFSYRKSKFSGKKKKEKAKNCCFLSKSQLSLQCHILTPVNVSKTSNLVRLETWKHNLSHISLIMKRY